MRREADGTLVTHAELGARVGGYPSDMVVDSEDRAFVGEFGFDLFGGAPLEMAARAARRSRWNCQLVWFATGSVISDSAELLVVETFGHRVN